MQGLLIRVGIDQAYGHWNAPMDPASNEFAYVPIPEGRETSCRSGCERRFQEVVGPLADFAHRHDVDCPLPPTLDDRLMHLDPDFEHLTYGDHGDRRGAGLLRLGHGDILAFYAGLRPVRPCGQKLVYSLVGLMIVDEVVPAPTVPRARWHENAHTRREILDPSEVVVRAQRRGSGRLERCLPIGEWRDRAYRVRPEILDAWGGLSVRDGYIQRSAVPPSFLDAGRFHEWFLGRKVPLLQYNNP